MVLVDLPCTAIPVIRNISSSVKKFRSNKADPERSKNSKGKYVSSSTFPDYSTNNAKEKVSENALNDKIQISILADSLHVNLENQEKIAFIDLQARSTNCFLNSI